MYGPFRDATIEVLSMTCITTSNHILGVKSILMKTCRLCLNKRDLKNSHIIPEFFYQPLYDKKHRLLVLSTKKKRPRPMEQKGVRERLLCGDCETKLSRWETYAAKVLTNIIIPNHDTEPFITVGDIDYRKFKLFELSVLWRVSVASHDIFKEIDLGPHEERIRSFMHKESTPQADDYGSMKFAIIDDGGIQLDFIYQAQYKYIEGYRVVFLIFGGYVWLFFVSGHSKKRRHTDGFLQTDGRLRIHKWPASELEEVKHFVRDIRAMGRGPKI